MNKETKFEILKSYFYGIEENSILEIYEIDKEELKKIIEDGGEYLEELKVRNYD